MPEKYIEGLEKAMKNLQIADHMAYVTYPLVKEKRLLLKILESVYESFIYAINSILQYEYLWKRITLYKDARANFQVFSEKCASRYGMTKEQVAEILELLFLVQKHKNSALEFLRKDKVVILSENMKTNVIDIEKIKKYLVLAKKLIQNTISYMSSKK